MRTLGAALTDEELAERLASLETKVAQQRAELHKLQTTITAPVSPQARENLQKAILKYKVWGAVWCAWAASCSVGLLLLVVVLPAESVGGAPEECVRFL